jgi:hypothetical protein
MITLVVTSGLSGTNFTVNRVEQVPCDPQMAARMQKSGQNPPRPRQIVKPVCIEELQPRTLEALHQVKLYIPKGQPPMAQAVTEGPLTFIQGNAKELADRAAAIIAREETAAGIPTALGAIDRTLATYS